MKAYLLAGALAEAGHQERRGDREAALCSLGGERGIRALAGEPAAAAVIGGHDRPGQRAGAVCGHCGNRLSDAAGAPPAVAVHLVEIDDRLGIRVGVEGLQPHQHQRDRLLVACLKLLAGDRVEVELLGSDRVGQCQHRSGGREN